MNEQPPPLPARRPKKVLSVVPELEQDSVIEVEVEELELETSEPSLEHEQQQQQQQQQQQLQQQQEDEEDGERGSQKSPRLPRPARLFKLDLRSSVDKVSSTLPDLRASMDKLGLKLAGRTSPRAVGGNVSPRKSGAGTSPRVGSPRLLVRSSSTVGEDVSSPTSGGPRMSPRPVQVGAPSLLSSSFSNTGDDAADPFKTVPRDVIVLIISFLNDRDVHMLSCCTKFLLGCCRADVVVLERRLRRAFPFNFERMWRLVCTAYPMMKIAGASLSYGERQGVLAKYIRDVIDRNEQWNTVAFSSFVEGGVLEDSLRGRAVFYVYNVIRNHKLRTSGTIDKFFADGDLVQEALSLFELRGCTLFDAMHVVFGHALSLPGEAQKIDRVMEALGKAFLRAQGDGGRSANTAECFYVLAFALVMLNSDLHNPAVKQRMSLSQFRKNIQGAVHLSDEESETLYMQVLRCEMIQSSVFVPRLTAKVWICANLGPLGYVRRRQAQISLSAGELVVNGEQRFLLKTCLVARNVAPAPLAPLLRKLNSSSAIATVGSPGRSAGGGGGGPTSDAQDVEISMLHVIRIKPGDTPDSLLRDRFNGRDLVISCDNLDELQHLQRCLSSHMLPHVQQLLTQTLRKLTVAASEM